MFERFARSWALIKASASVLQKDSTALYRQATGHQNLEEFSNEMLSNAFAVQAR